MVAVSLSFKYQDIDSKLPPIHDGNPEQSWVWYSGCSGLVAY
jgi:hypothetical protein